MSKKATAIRYDKGDEAPRIVAQGRGSTADTLVGIARKTGIPIVEMPSLAENLDGMRLFEAVPPLYWEAVAEILSFVYSTGGADELHQG